MDRKLTGSLTGAKSAQRSKRWPAETTRKYVVASWRILSRRLGTPPTLKPPSRRFAEYTMMSKTNASSTRKGLDTVVCAADKEKTYHTLAKAEHKPPHRFSKVGSCRSGTHRRVGWGIPSLPKFGFQLFFKGQDERSYQVASHHRLHWLSPKQPAQKS